jgi:signal transduction histidine kinase/cell division protein FtsB
MSYRTIKRLLGESSLELKFHFLFGSGLLLLITGSFYVYAQLNLGVVRAQQRERAQLLLSQNILARHWKLLNPPTKAVDEAARDPLQEFAYDLMGNDPDGMINGLNVHLKPERLRKDDWKFIPVDYDDDRYWDAANRPSGQAETDAINALLSGRTEFVVRADRSSRKHEYYQPIQAEEFCVKCHEARAGGALPFAKDGVFGVAKINFELADTEREIAKNNAFLIATAIATAALAMAAAWAIVRYVIVKPVLHLNEVSEAIAHGDLDQRADIRTGDEFEELSHAFNRMLRHLVTIQDELRQVNTDLDAKVDQLAQVNLNLHETNKLKSEFLATMSHELRTPLNSILGFSDILAEAGNLDERQRKYLANIRTSGRNLLALINDILDLAKIEAGKMELHVTDVTAGDVVERQVAAMLPIAERKNIDLQWDVDHDVPVLRQDAGKLQQVLNNLLSNAVKFTPEGGRVRFRARMSGDENVEFIVADTGIGIPLEDQAHIFEKFRQGKNISGRQDALTREYEGTGLGLSIVKELTKLLGGEVSLESEFGKGSTFTVRVPVRVEPDEATEEPPSTLEFRRPRAAS